MFLRRSKSVRGAAGGPSDSLEPPPLTASSPSGQLAAEGASQRIIIGASFAATPGNRVDATAKARASAASIGDPALREVIATQLARELPNPTAHPIASLAIVATPKKAQQAADEVAIALHAAGRLPKPEYIEVRHGATYAQLRTALQEVEAEGPALLLIEARALTQDAKGATDGSRAQNLLYLVGRFMGAPRPQRVMIAGPVEDLIDLVNAEPSLRHRFVRVVTIGGKAEFPSVLKL